jgi:penicillin-binding protein 2
MKQGYNDDSQSKQIQIKRNLSLRLNLMFFAVFILFSALIVRLAILQFVEGKELANLESIIATRETKIAPIRGNIYDDQGAPLAYTISVQSLFFRIEPTQQDKQEVIALARRLAEIFQTYGSSESKKPTAEQIVLAMDLGYDIELKKTQEPNYYFTPRRIKADLSKQEIAYILEHRDELKWLEVSEESIRTYEQSEDKTTTATQLIGYLQKYSTRTAQNLYANNPDAEQYILTEDVGVDGIERMYQDELRGSNGGKSYPVNALEKIIGRVTITPPTRGNNIFLTINKKVQQATEKAITDQLTWLQAQDVKTNKYAALGKNARSGYAVAMEVKTGKVISMASMPDYDANLWRGGITQEEYDQIKQFVNNGTITTAYSDYPAAELPKHPTSLVFLGSTIKPLTVLFGLSEGLLTATEKYLDTGKFSFGKQGAQATISNSDQKAYGNINAKDAIRFSSNTFMSAMIANRLYFRDFEEGLLTWQEFIKKFGLGVLTGSGLPREYEGSNDFIENAKTSSSQSALVYASWGQNGKYTTLQLAQFAATLANKGTRMKPLFVNEIKTYEGELVKQVQPEVIEKSEFPDEYWNILYTGMKEVNKTGFEGVKYSVAAKTGTSTMQIGGMLIDNAVFIAFAPIENPQLAVAVVVPEGGFGSIGAAPIARKIFDAYFEQYGVDGSAP